MSELRELTAAARQLRDQRLSFVSATVVSVRGSGYRKAGARMLATPDRRRAGSISGGCLERDVVTKGFWYTRSGSARLITYDQEEANALDARGGTGCQGVVEVLVERHDPEAADEADFFRAAERCIRDETVATVLTVTRSTRADLPLGARLVLQAGRWHVPAQHAGLRALFEHEALDAMARRSSPYLAERVSDGAAITVLVECIEPPVHLFVFGTAHDASPVVALGKSLGWSVSVWDGSPRSSARERLQLADQYLTGSVPDAVARLSRCVRGAAVVMGHDLERDHAAVDALLSSGIRYVGILGSRSRTERILASCRVAGNAADGAARSHVYAPVGLQLGAETPAEIALAIVAQVQAVFARSDPGVSRPRSRPTKGGLGILEQPSSMNASESELRESGT